jgi:CheY-like chemotaxis protein
MKKDHPPLMANTPFESNARSAAESSTPAPEREGMPRLLIAEDDPIIRQILATLLQRSNYALDFAGDGQQAVEMWELGEYDLILMDIQMPRLSGFEATAVIRKQERSRGGHIPIIAITAYGFDEESCLAAGMDYYLAKPLDFQQTRQVIGAILTRKCGSDGK